MAGKILTWLNENSASVANLILLLTAWVALKANNDNIKLQQGIEKKKDEKAEAEYNRKKRNLVRNYLADYWKLADKIKVKFDDIERSGFQSQQFPDEIIDLLLLGKKIQSNLLPNYTHTQEVVVIMERMNNFTDFLFNQRYNNNEHVTGKETMTLFRSYRDYSSTKEMIEQYNGMIEKHIQYLSSYTEDMKRLLDLMISYGSESLN